MLEELAQYGSTGGEQLAVTASPSRSAETVELESSIEAEPRIANTAATRRAPGSATDAAPVGGRPLLRAVESIKQDPADAAKPVIAPAQFKRPAPEADVEFFVPPHAPDDPGTEQTASPARKAAS